MRKLDSNLGGIDFNLCTDLNSEVAACRLSDVLHDDDADRRARVLLSLLYSVLELRLCGDLHGGRRWIVAES